MAVHDLEIEALKLPAVERARLARVLLESLDDLSADERRRLWANEAARRDGELDVDLSRRRPVAEVFRDARSRSLLTAPLASGTVHR